jgi:hypothetical protein
MAVVAMIHGFVALIISIKDSIFLLSEVSVGVIPNLIGRFSIC